MEYKNIEDFDIENKRVLLRVDLNVPRLNNQVLDKTRIEKIIPTLKYLISQKAKIILVSHFGRPKGTYSADLSLEFLKNEIEKLIPIEVIFSRSAIGIEAENLSKAISHGQILLLENIRFYPGESKNDPEFAKELAKLADYYVNDAFSCSHRAHASICRIREFLPSAYGLLLREEISSLTKFLESPEKAILAIVGGSKVSTKLTLLKSLLEKVDYLFIGGAMANTFLKAKGYNIGNSLYEPELIEEALYIAQSSKVILPVDLVVAEKIAESASNYITNVEDFVGSEMILDIGPETVKNVNELILKSKTLIINGPVGVFEYFPFSVGTTAIIREIAKQTLNKKLISIAGGGDIIAAVTKSGLYDQLSYISTAGGAFLEWLEGKKLPGL